MTADTEDTTRDAERPTAAAGLVAVQAALRRMALLVSRDTPADAVFAAITEEVARVLGAAFVELARLPADGRPAAVSTWGRPPERPTPSASVSAAILTDGRAWGRLSAWVGEGPLAPDAAERLSDFAELVATTIATIEAREEVRRLAEEQAALRRVATLIAKGAPTFDVFQAVAREVAAVLGIPMVDICRYEPDGSATVVGVAGSHPFQPGTNWPLDGPSLTALVRESARPARIDSYANVEGTLGTAAWAAGVRGGVGAPIVVDGALWGVVSAVGDDRAIPGPGAEDQLMKFTELAATAIANTQARQDAAQLAEEQAALRRVTALVARGQEPRTVFDAVCRETGRLLGAATVNLARFDDDGGECQMVAGWSLRGVHLPTGTTVAVGGDNAYATVQQTGAPGRADSYATAHGPLAALLRRRGIRSEVGAPVVVEGRLWGALVAGTDEVDPLPATTEPRLGDFAELVATAISNASARSELLASRARLVAAADEQRRRVVRDLHDGAQQRLVRTIVNLQLARSRSDVPPELSDLLDTTLTNARAAIDELRELARGIHPTVLSHHGLRAAVEALADRAPLPVTIEIPDDRYPAPIESAAYFVAAEALTNIAKYANADEAQVTVTADERSLVLTITDDGVGGARMGDGTGLSGLTDRVAALGGRLTVDSPTGGGTTVRAEIPLTDRPPDPSDG